MDTVLFKSGQCVEELNVEPAGVGSAEKGEQVLLCITINSVVTLEILLNVSVFKSLK